MAGTEEGGERLVSGSGQQRQNDHHQPPQALERTFGQFYVFASRDSKGTVLILA